MRIDIDRLKEIVDWTKRESEQYSRMAKNDSLEYCRDNNKEDKRYSALKNEAVSIAYQGVHESLVDLLQPQPSEES